MIGSRLRGCRLAAKFELERSGVPPVGKGDAQHAPLGLGDNSREVRDFPLDKPEADCHKALVQKLGFDRQFDLMKVFA
jgi:hypothetical protein